MLLVDDDNTRRNASAVEQVGWQTDDPFDVALTNQIATDVGFGIATKQHSVRQNAGSLAGALERSHDVQ